MGLCVTRRYFDFAAWVGVAVVPRDRSAGTSTPDPAPNRTSVISSIVCRTDASNPSAVDETKAAFTERKADNARARAPQRGQKAVDARYLLTPVVIAYVVTSGAPRFFGPVRHVGSVDGPGFARSRVRGVSTADISAARTAAWLDG